MRAFATFCLFAAACSSHPPTPIAPAPTAAVTYKNPLIDDDFADPMVMRDGDWFYAYATQINSGSRVINVQAARSRDLVTWERLPDAMPQKPAWAHAQQDFWAPHVIHEGGLYYMYFSGRADADGNMCIGVATSPSPTGPFADVGKPITCGPGFTNIDPFTLDDAKTGKHFLYWGSGFQPIFVQELADNRTELKPLTAPIPLIAPRNLAYEHLIEGTWITERDGWYYLFYSGDSCCGKTMNYGVLVARSRSPMGPFERKPVEGVPIILAKNAEWLGPGHNAVIRDDAGDDWMLYHAVDPAKPTQPCPGDGPGTLTSCNGNGDLPMRRPLLMDRIVYRDGWPELPGAPSRVQQRGPAFRGAK